MISAAFWPFEFFWEGLILNPSMGPARLVSGAYAAAVDDALWLSWCRDMNAHFDSVGSMFFIVDVAGREVVRAGFASDRFDPTEFLAEWEALKHLDPQIPAVFNGLGDGFYTDADHLRTERPAGDEWSKWVWDRWGAHHHATIYANLGKGLRGGITLHQEAGRDGLDSAKLAQLNGMMPGLRDAMRLGLDWERLAAENFWSGIDAVSRQSALLLDGSGRVLRTNAAADRLFRAEDGLTLKNGRLFARDPSSDDSLQAALAATLRPAAPVGATVLIARQRAAQPLYLSCQPIARGRRFLSLAEASALVRVEDPSASIPMVAIARFSDACRLSEREGQVLRLLSLDADLSGISDTLGISRETVRVHIRNIYAKAGVNSRTAIIELLRNCDGSRLRSDGAVLPGEAFPLRGPQNVFL